MGKNIVEPRYFNFIEIYEIKGVLKKVVKIKKN